VDSQCIDQHTNINHQSHEHQPSPKAKPHFTFQIPVPNLKTIIFYLEPSGSTDLSLPFPSPRAGPFTPGGAAWLFSSPNFVNMAAQGYAMRLKETRRLYEGRLAKDNPFSFSRAGILLNIDGKGPRTGCRCRAVSLVWLLYVVQRY
jgi:hypothetical protein